MVLGLNFSQFLKRKSVLLLDTHTTSLVQLSIMIIVDFILRSCGTLQRGMELIQKQRPLEGKADVDSMSESTTIPILGNGLIQGNSFLLG